MSATTDEIQKYLDHRVSGRRRVRLEDAACADQSVDMFFGSNGASARAAKRICLKCEVRWDCLVYAIDTRQPDGIWGGLTSDERSRLQRLLKLRLAELNV